MADISQITLPNGVTYNLKDSVAREAGTTDFIGASIGTDGDPEAIVSGTHGLVPAPASPKLLLSADGTWQSLTWNVSATADDDNGILISGLFGNTVITNFYLPTASQSTPGLMSASDKTWLDLIRPATTTTGLPLMDGVASIGSSTAFARANHVHPTDTSRAPLASPAFTGTPTAPTATAGTNTTQIATTAFVKTAIDAVTNDVEIGSAQPTSESIKLWIEI